jgi:transposase InsO family protein
VLRRAVAWFANRGVTVERVLSDNGSCYRSFLWRDTCLALSITHKRTRPYRPQTNGKICEESVVVLHRPGLTPAKV